MVYKLGNLADMDRLPVLYLDTWKVVRDSVSVLSQEYGTDRDVDSGDGGYVLYVEPETPPEEIKAIFDYTACQVEYVTLHRHTEPLVCSALYILNNEYTVTIIMSVEDAPTEYLNEMQGD